MTKERLKAVSLKIRETATRHKIALESVTENQQKAVKAERKERAAKELYALILEAGKYTQNKVAERLKVIVNKALSIVFEDQYEIDILFQEKRGRTETEIILKENGSPIDDMMEDSGGVLDVLSFSMRLAFWAMNKTAGVFIIDEPFRNLSIDLQSRAADMLKVMANQLDIQIIMASHNPEIIACADRLFNVDNGKVTVEA